MLKIADNYWLLGVYETKLQNNFRFSLKNILKDHFILLLNETLS